MDIVAAGLSKPERRIGPGELLQHKQDLWVAIHGRVYAVSDFHHHPGGIEVLRHEAGRDATRIFDEIGHSKAAKRMLPRFDIGAFISQEEESATAESRIADVTTPDASAQVANAIDSVCLNGSAQVDNRSCSPLVPEIVQSVDPNDSLTCKTPSNGANDGQHEFRPPAPAFKQQEALVGEIHRRAKQPLAPGFSAMAWLRRHQVMPQRPMRKWKLPEIALHNKLDDAWLVLHGLVYDVTPYMPYHPGGVDELLRGAGRDVSSLFGTGKLLHFREVIVDEPRLLESVHPWVNANAMLMRCCVGILDT